MGDKERLDKVYSQTDKLIEQYISKKGSKYDLLMWLVQAKRMTKDKEFVKWCDKSIKKLE